MAERQAQKSIAKNDRARLRIYSILYGQNFEYIQLVFNALLTLSVFFQNKK